MRGCVETMDEINCLAVEGHSIRHNNSRIKFKVREITKKGLLASNRTWNLIQEGYAWLR